MTVAREGKLTKRDPAAGRWTLGRRVTLTKSPSGDMFELKVLGVWQKARMESFQGKYYSVPELPLKVGLIARYIGRSIGF